MTFRDSNRFAKAFDDLDEGWNLSKKTELMTWLGKYLCREQISAQDMSLEAFRAFTQRHPVFLFKPSTGSYGIGIEKADASVTPVEELFSRFAGQDGVLDECILQHPAMEKLHPDSVYTMRIVSVRIRSDVHIAGAVLRMGNGGSFIDNYSAGELLLRSMSTLASLQRQRKTSMGKDTSTIPIRMHRLLGFKSQIGKL